MATETQEVNESRRDVDGRTLLLLNRKARSGGQPIEAALNVFGRAGYELDIRDCADAAAMARIIRGSGGHFGRVVVGGGDGTLNCAAPAVIAAGLPLGILPLGTANDLARTLAIPPDPAAAAAVIVAGDTRRIDLGEVNGRPFFNVASIGFSADLARELTAEMKRRFGVAGYAVGGLRLLARMRPFRAYIEHDGRVERVRTLQISVGNGRHYGGGLTVDLAAEPDDGVFHVYSLEIARWWDLFAIVPRLRRGTHGELGSVRAFTTASVTVRTSRARSVNTDGELTTATPAVFKILRSAVAVYAPAQTIKGADGP